MTSKNASLCELRDTLSEDLQKASQFIEKFRQKITKIDIFISEHENHLDNNKIQAKCELMELDLYLIQNIVRKFNTLCNAIQTELQLNEITFENPWLNHPKYPPYDIKPYIPGYRLKGMISHIVDADKGLFYFLDYDRSAGISSVFKIFDKGQNLTPITNLTDLENGDIVATKTDGYFARAIYETTDKGVILFLIDTGELLSPNNNVELYHIPDIYKKLPAQAIYCKLVNSENSQKFLNKFIYEEIQMEVIDTKDNIIHVQSITEVLSVVSEISEQKSEKSHFSVDTEPKTKSDKSHLSENSEPKTEKSNFSSTNPFLADLLEKTLVNNDTTPVVQHFNYMDNDKNEIDENDLREWMNDDDEHCETSNAMVAVLGYDPKDEGRYCKFYDGVSEGCWKGANCRFIHQKPLEDGQSRDQDVAVCDIPDKLPIPNYGAELSIEMVYCEDVHIFYGHILNAEFHRNDSVTLKSFNRVINKAENMAKYKKMKKVPVRGELVLAPYANAFYRGKVINVTDELCEIFFVDYGNKETVKFKELYKWETSFGDIPFQAVRFVIAGVIPKRGEKILDRANALFELIQGHILSATVISVGFDTEVRLYQGPKDVTDLLMQTKYVLPVEIKGGYGKMSLVPS